MLKLLRRIVLPLADLLPRRAQQRIYSRFRAHEEMGKLKRASIVVVSFPKSGRTWFRAMLSYLFQEVFALETDRLLGHKNYARENGKVPVVAFTHDNHPRAAFGDEVMAALYRTKKIILVVRDPRDVEVSTFFHFAFRLDSRKKKTLGINVSGEEAEIFDHLRERLTGDRNTVVFLNRWARRAAQESNILVVRYEDLKADAVGELRRVCTFIGLSASEAQMRSAAERASFSSMRSKERQGGFDHQESRFGSRGSDSDDAFKVRRGKVGGYEDYLSPAQVEEINALIDSHLATGFGYRSDEKDAAGARGRPEAQRVPSA